MPAQCPHITSPGECGLLQFGFHIEVILFGFNAVIEQSRQFLFIKAGEQRVKVHALQRLDLHTQKLLIPSGVHRHAVVRNDVCFLLRLGEVVGKDTRHFLDAFLLRRQDSSVACDHAIVTIDDDGIDEAELPERRAELSDLLRGVGAGVVRIGYQLSNRHKLHFRCRFHRTSPHSANFSKPPRDWMYFRAVSTTSL